MAIPSLMNIIDTSTTHVTRFVLFNYIKTGDPIIDTLLVTFLLSFFSLFVSWVYESHLTHMLHNLSIDDIQSFFFKKNSIIIEGKRSSTVCQYNSTMAICTVYSDRFKAIWQYIINRIENNSTIYKLKENHSNVQKHSYGSKLVGNGNYEMYMVYQNRHFKIDEDIYVRTDIEMENDSGDQKKASIKTDKITIVLYSYKYSLSYLKNYIENIKEKYLENIKNSRSNRRFIYTLDKVDFNIDNDESIYDCWREDLFESSRTFRNIFFDGKDHLLQKIDFFLNNRSWYYEKGIPYSLGIGLHGPPGTGKTSFIKALANYTNRHLVVISLKLIKTRQQLEKFFFENTYNENNEQHSVSWNNKILVFEDIDCIGDIIMERNKKISAVICEKGDKYNIKLNDTKLDAEDTSDSELSVKEIIEVMKSNHKSPSDIMKLIKNITDTGMSSAISSDKDIPITLDDILNLWDGIRETPGRILVISSNHYDKLDSALTRPGRIDITHELKNASHKTISEIFTHLFGKSIDETKLAKISEYLYSPAEIINIFVANQDEESFIEHMMKNKGQRSVSEDSSDYSV